MAGSKSFYFSLLIQLKKFVFGLVPHPHRGQPGADGLAPPFSGQKAFLPRKEFVSVLLFQCELKVLKPHSSLFTGLSQDTSLA